MSMDIVVWTTEAPNLPLRLPQSSDWEFEEDGGSYWFESETWSISVEYASSVPTPAVTKLVANAAWATTISLQPISAPSDGYLFLEQVVRTLCAAQHGCWGVAGDDVFRRHDQGRF